MRRPVLLSALLAAVLAASEARANAPRFFTYVDEGMRLKVPQGWTVLPEEGRALVTHEDARLVIAWVDDGTTEGAILLGKELARLGEPTPDTAVRTERGDFYHYRFDLGPGRRRAEGLVSDSGRNRLLVLVLAPASTFEALGGEEFLRSVAQGSSVVSHEVGRGFFDSVNIPSVVPKVHDGWSIAAPADWVFRRATSAELQVEHRRGGLLAPGFSYAILDSDEEIPPAVLAQSVLASISGMSEAVVLRRKDTDLFTTYPRRIMNEHWLEARVVIEGKPMYLGIIARGNKATPCYAILNGGFDETRKAGGFALLRSMFLSVGPAPSKPIDIVGAWEYGNTAGLLNYYDLQGNWTRDAYNTSAVVVLFRRDGWYELIVYSATKNRQEQRMVEHETGRYVFAGSVLLMQPGRSRTHFFIDGKTSRETSKGGPLYVRYVRQGSDGELLLTGPGILGPSRSFWNDAETVGLRPSDVKKPFAKGLSGK